MKSTDKTRRRRTFPSRTPVIDERHDKAFEILFISSQRRRVNVFDEVLKRLETIACAEIQTRAISYGIIFMGFYRGVGFEFNVYVNSQGCLNPKSRQNPVWHKPVTPPGTLRHEIDEVIRRIKGIEGNGDVTVPRGAPPPLGSRSSMTDLLFRYNRTITRSSADGCYVPICTVLYFSHPLCMYMFILFYRHNPEWQQYEGLINHKYPVLSTCAD